MAISCYNEWIASHMVKYTRIITIVLVTLMGSGFFVASATADTIGQSRTFFVNRTFDLYGRQSLIATLQHSSSHIELYTDDRYWNDLTTSQRSTLLQAMILMVQNFDSTTYPIETAFWGSEPNPGVDNSPKITLLFHAMLPGNGGYFDSIHNYPTEPGRDSNVREMIFINFDSLMGSFTNVFLGHEFQHLISSNQKELLRNVNEEVWLNEARSEFTASLLNQNTPYVNSSLYRRVQNFLRTPSDSLTEWLNVPTDYGIVTVFVEYLAGRFGDRILNNTLQSPSAGIGSLDHYFANNGYAERFSDVFLDWMVASYLNDPTLHAKHAYVKSDLGTIRVQPTMQGVVPSSGQTILTANVKYWQPVWYDIFVNTAAVGVKVTLLGQALERPIAQAVLQYSDGSYDVRRIDPVNGTRTVYVEVAGAGKQLTHIMIAGTYSQLKSGSASVPSYPLTVTASSVSAEELAEGLKTQTASTIVDGVLIERNNAETEAYVVWGAYKRYLRPEIIALYGHLDPAATIPVDGVVFDGYRTSNYVRYVNDPKVYAIWPDGTKHWLRISAQRFAESGRDWNSIFIINESELNSYRTGSDITQ